MPILKVKMIREPLPSVLPLLAGEKSPAVDDALVAALPHMDSLPLEEAVNLLVSRNDEFAIEDLISQFRHYSVLLQSLLITHADRLADGIRRAVESPLLENRESGIEFIQRAHHAPSAYLLANAIRSECPKTRDRAAAAFYNLADHLVTQLASDVPLEKPDALRHQAQCLTQALREALLCWELHTQPRILIAAAWLIDALEPTLVQKIGEPKSKIGAALIHTLQGASDPRLAEFALRALTMPQLRETAMRTIAKANDPRFLRALLAESHLLKEPRIEQEVRKIQDLSWFGERGEKLLELDAKTQEAALEFIAMTGGPKERKLELYRHLLNQGSAEMREAVVGRLRDDESDGASQLLALTAGRGWEEVSPIAGEEIRRRRSEPMAPANPPAHPPREQNNPSDSFESLWRMLDYCDPAERSEVFARMPQEVHDLPRRLRAKLALASAENRVRALQLVHALSLTRELEEQVYKATHDPEPMVRSLAVSMLANLPGATSNRICRTATNDPDERVQANAIEVLDELDAPDRARCTQSKLKSPASRVRANAIKSLLRMEMREAGDALLDMLDDESRSHRISGLWVVERLQLTAVLRRVNELSLSDPDPQVRQRAKRILGAIGMAQTRIEGRTATR